MSKVTSAMQNFWENFIPILVTSLITGVSALIANGYPIDWKTTGIAALFAFILSLLNNLQRMFQKQITASGGKKKDNKGFRFLLFQK